MDVKQVIVLLLQRYHGALFGKNSIISHCLDLLSRYHYALVLSSFIPAMEYKIMYVYFFLKDPMPYLFEIMYMG